VSTAMDLLRSGQRAGLAVVVDGERLTIRGPKTADAVARALLDRKAEVLALQCSRCGALPVDREPLVAYWGPVVCPACCQTIGARGGEFDQQGTWPPNPWRAAS
jgi:hypothetical protein